jgi:hypothetical protein
MMLSSLSLNTQAFRNAIVLRQAGSNLSAMRVADHVSNNNKHAHQPFSGHETRNSVRVAESPDTKHMQRYYRRQ